MITKKSVHNFHLPLHHELYDALKAESSRQKRPATELARQALELWLKEQRQLALREEIATYAIEAAGTPDDLDEALEASSIDCLLSEVPSP